MLSKISSRIKICLALLLFSTIQSHAVDFVDFSKAKRTLEVDVHALGGVSTMAQNYESKFPQIQNLNVNMGASLGVGARAVFGLREYFGFGTAFDLMLNNNNIDMAVLGDDNSSMSSVFIDNRFYYINIPLFVSFRFNVARNVRWNVDAGFYYAYGFAGTQKQRIYRTELNEMDEFVAQMVNIKTDYFHSPDTFINSFNRGDIGFHMATSLNFGRHLLVGMKFQAGMKNSARQNGLINPSVRNVYLHAVVGYRF